MWTLTGNNKFPIDGYFDYQSKPNKWQFNYSEKIGNNTENVFLRQIRLALNERRKAIFENVPHHQISEVDWAAMWVEIDPDRDYTEDMKNSAVSMLEFYHKEILKAGRYFVLITEDLNVPPGANDKDILFLDSIEKIVYASHNFGNYADIPSADEKKWEIGGSYINGGGELKYGWTVLPKRLGILPPALDGFFSEHFNDELKYSLDEEGLPFILCAEHFNEMFNAINMMTLLTPAYTDIQLEVHYGEVDYAEEGKHASYSLCDSLAQQAVEKCSSDPEISTDLIWQTRGLEVRIMSRVTGNSREITGSEGKPDMTYGGGECDKCIIKSLKEWWLIYIPVKYTDQYEFLEYEKILYSAETLDVTWFGHFTEDGTYFSDGEIYGVLFFKECKFKFKNKNADFYWT